jgi:hypothetical protein
VGYVRYIGICHCIFPPLCGCSFTEIFD